MYFIWINNFILLYNLTLKTVFLKSFLSQIITAYFNFGLTVFKRLRCFFLLHINWFRLVLQLIRYAYKYLARISEIFFYKIFSRFLFCLEKLFSLVNRAAFIIFYFKIQKILTYLIRKFISINLIIYFLSRFQNGVITTMKFKHFTDLVINFLKMRFMIEFMGIFLILITLLYRFVIAINLQLILLVFFFLIRFLFAKYR